MAAHQKEAENNNLQWGPFSSVDRGDVVPRSESKGKAGCSGEKPGGRKGPGGPFRTLWSWPESESWGEHGAEFWGGVKILKDYVYCHSVTDWATQGTPWGDNGWGYFGGRCGRIFLRKNANASWGFKKKIHEGNEGGG